MSDLKKPIHTATFDYQKAIDNVHNDSTIPAFKRREIARRLEILKSEKGGEKVSIGNDDNGLYWEWKDANNQEGRTGGVADALKSKVGVGGKGFLGLKGNKFDEAYDYMVARGYYNNLDKPAPSTAPPKTFPDLSKFNLNYNSQLSPTQFEKSYQSAPVVTTPTSTVNQNAAVPEVKPDLAKNLQKNAEAVKADAVVDSVDAKIQYYQEHPDEFLKDFTYNSHKYGDYGESSHYVSRYIYNGLFAPSNLNIKLIKTKDGKLAFGTDHDNHIYYFDKPGVHVSHDDLPDNWETPNLFITRFNQEGQVDPKISEETLNNIKNNWGKAFKKRINLIREHSGYLTAGTSPIISQLIKDKRNSITNEYNLDFYKTKYNRYVVRSRNYPELGYFYYDNLKEKVNPYNVIKDKPVYSVSYSNGGKLRLVPKKQYGGFMDGGIKSNKFTFYNPVGVDFEDTNTENDLVKINPLKSINIKNDIIPDDSSLRMFSNTPLKSKTVSLKNSVSTDLVGDTKNHVRDAFGNENKFNFKLPIGPIVDFLTSKPQTVEVPKAPLVQYKPISERQERGLSNDTINTAKKNFQEAAGQPVKSSSQSQVISSVFAKDNAAQKMATGIMQNDIQLRERTHDQQVQDERQNQATEQKVINQNNGIIYKNNVNEAQADLKAKLVKQQRWGNLIKGVVNANTANELTDNNSKMMAEQQSFNLEHKDLLGKLNRKEISEAEFLEGINALKSKYSEVIKNFLQNKIDIGSVRGFLSGLFSKHSSGGKLADKVALAKYKSSLRLRSKNAENKLKSKIVDKKIALQREKLILKYNKDFFDMLRKMK